MAHLVVGLTAVYGLPATPARPLKTVVHPDAPPWAIGMWTTSNDIIGWQLLGVVLWVFLTVAGFAFAAWSPPVGWVLGLVPTAGVTVAASRTRRFLFRAPAWQFNGVPVTGKGLDMVEDIQSRFEYARRLVGEVPTGIDWHSIKREVATIMWDSVEHAAQVSTLDREISDMRYAASGTPQAAMKRRLEERRTEHWAMLLHNQREAESLARVAGNALAAAKVALAKTGSMKALEVVAPSGRVLAARATLAEARARLVLLADAWAELDESGDIAAERLGLNDGEGER